MIGPYFDGYIMIDDGFVQSWRQGFQAEPGRAAA
jgi:hypothetical protein